MFDRQFQKLWSATDVQIHIDRDDLDYIFDEENLEGEELSITVSWDDCEMAEYFCERNSSTILEYTVEINPETEVGGSLLKMKIINEEFRYQSSRSSITSLFTSNHSIRRKSKRTLYLISIKFRNTAQGSTG